MSGSAHITNGGSGGMMPNGIALPMGFTGQFWDETSSFGMKLLGSSRGE